VWIIVFAWMLSPLKRVVRLFMENDERSALHAEIAGVVPAKRSQKRL